MPRITGNRKERETTKWFKNGNMHIVFKRMDLVREINKIAGCDKLDSKEAA